jgi:hypothetical protein
LSNSFADKSLRRAATAGGAAWPALLLLSVVAFASAGAQVIPNIQWKTIETPHFRIHFSPALEQMARRTAPNAERAFALLSRELVPPRGKVDLVIADNVDYTNGYATPFPSNRIVIYAHPPVDDAALRNYADWSQLVVTHELTHIFHLDRAKGLWKLGRYVVGRHPALFPNEYLPAWVIEGLAVYYESRLTGTGRLEGSEHYMVARAAAEERAFPRLGEVSLATTRFPGGETVYAYGGFMFDYLSRTRGEKSIRDFVEFTSGAIFPLTLNGKSNRVFGVSFDRAWKQWTDSLMRATPPASQPMPGWRQLTNEGWLLSSPRWLDNSTLIYGASTGREVTQAYTVTMDGREESLGRRNGLGPDSPLPNGDLVFSQPELLDPYRVFNDLYVQRGKEQIQLTRGARIGSPDARRDGAIIAVQNVPGSTRLVRVTADGRTIVPITPGTLDEQWFEPRWSPDGNRIAAIRLPRGARPEIVVFDTLGTIGFSYRFQSAIPGTPSWSPDGTKLFFSSDHTGTRQVYSLLLTADNPSIERLSDVVTGLFAPEASPDSARLAALLYRADGYHLGVAPLPRTPSSTRDTAILGERESCSTCRISDIQFNAVGSVDSSVATRYSPWRSLLPTYWEPVVESSTGLGTRVGGATSGTDIIGRHAYFAQATFNTKFREGEGFGIYRYAGLGQPFLDFSAEQAWDHFGVGNSAGDRVGDLAQRSRIYSVSATLSRPRYRTSTSLSLGGEIETRDYATDPNTLLRLLPTFYSQTSRYPSVFVSGTWTNTRRAPLSISREDGISFSATARERWRNTPDGGGGAPSRSVVGVGAAYKALDLPGFAHHVIAVRGAAGFEDERAISTFNAGGLSGSAVTVVGDVTLGGERRIFGVRGFPPSVEHGTRAFAGTAEYRAPLAAPSRHIPYVPLLFDRVSLAGFADAGRAYCPVAAVSSAIVCDASDAKNPWLASVGGELDLDAALYSDTPLRIRLGVAAPVANRDYARARAASLYLTFGSSF